MKVHKYTLYTDCRFFEKCVVRGSLRCLCQARLLFRSTIRGFCSGWSFDNNSSSNSKERERNSFQTLRLIKINFRLMMLVASQRMQKIFTPFKMAVDKQRLYGTHEHFIKIIMVWVQFSMYAKNLFFFYLVVYDQCSLFLCSFSWCFWVRPRSQIQ